MNEHDLKRSTPGTLVRLGYHGSGWAVGVARHTGNGRIDRHYLTPGGKWFTERGVKMVEITTSDVPADVRAFLES